MARKDISNKLMIFESGRKSWQSSAEKVMSKKNQGLQHRGGKTLLPSNDKNNVIVKYLLSYLSKGPFKVKDK